MSGALGEALEAACRHYGESIALSGADLALTYNELAQRAHLLARRLREAGSRAQEPIHVLVSNQPLDVAALMGVWLAGGVAVPVHRTTPAAVAAAFQQRTQARFLIDFQAEPQNAELLSSLTPIVPPERALLESAAFIVFTSGSTGVPKGVVIAHQAFHEKLQQIDSLLHFKAGERTLLVLNITFSFGLWTSLLTLLRGGTLVMQAKFEPEPFLAALASERITRVSMVPTMMRVLFSDERQLPEIERVAQLGSLRQILIGGESLGRSLAESIRRRFAKTDLIDIYGLTETATCDFFAFPADFAAFPGCIGRPSPNVRYRIVGPEDNPVDDGAIGELQIRSPYLMNGYLDEPKLTAAAYCDGWLRTGDLGRVIDGQVVQLMGRKKDVINRGGNKVTPVEIEQAICSHPDIAAAMAVGIEDALLGERIHVLLLPRAGSTLDLSEVRKHLETRLERFKRPDVYYLAAALPLGRTGKADALKFKAQVIAGKVEPLDA